MAGINIHTLLWAAVGGILPTFLWLWFWLEECDDDTSPGLIALAYIGGMIGVLILLPLKPYVVALNLSTNQITILYAILEEVVKFGIVALITFGSSTIRDGSDYVVYLVTGALGFSALENTLYLVTPIMQNSPVNTIVITGNLRFFGATVLHTMSVALVGVILGLAYSAGALIKTLHAIVGICLAAGLHMAFNYFIMQGTRQGTIIAIAGIWFVAVIVILLFDRLRALQENIESKKIEEEISVPTYQVN